MMRWKYQEFVESRALGQLGNALRKKTINLQKNAMLKPVELGLLSVAVPESYGGNGNGLCLYHACLVIIFQEHQVFQARLLGRKLTGYAELYYYLCTVSEDKKQKYVPKIGFLVNWFGAYCLTRARGLDRCNSGKTKVGFYRDGITALQVKNVGFRQDSVVCSIVFCSHRDDSIRFFVEQIRVMGNHHGWMRKKLGISIPLLRVPSFSLAKVLQPNMLSEGAETDSKLLWML